jgi:SAM-dependent methyltransferase
MCQRGHLPTNLVYIQAKNSDGTKMTTKKDFNSIVNAYDFFASHSTEKDANANAMASEISSWIANKHINFEEVSILDFGGGDGHYLSYLLNKLPSKPASITLLDPATTYREAAKSNLASRANGSLKLVSSLQEIDLKEKFDLIVANHVFYYIPDLVRDLKLLKSILKQNGIFMATMAGDSNALILAWKTFFSDLSMPIPYNLAGDFAVALQQVGLKYKSLDLSAKFQFPDSEEGRKLTTDFLLGSNAQKLKTEQRDAFFNKYEKSGLINLPIYDHLFLVEP